MVDVRSLDVRCDNCGALVSCASSNTAVQCAYCGARYRVRSQAADAGDVDEMLERETAHSATIRNPIVWIEVHSFGGAVWLAIGLFLGVMGIGWVMSSVPLGGILLLASLALWFLAAIAGRLAPRPPSWVARMSAWSLGNLFPMGPLWGLLVSSGVVAILFARGATIDAADNLEKARVAAGAAASAIAPDVPVAPQPAPLPLPLDGTCRTLPMTGGWWGLHPALVPPSNREQALAALSATPGHVLILGEALAQANPAPGDRLAFTTITGIAIPPDAGLAIPAVVIKESGGDVRYGVLAGEKRIAVLFFSGKARRLVLVDRGTWKAGKPVALPGRIRPGADSPAMAAGGGAFAVAWRDGKTIAGSIVAETGRIAGGFKLAEGAPTVGPRVAWNGKGFGVLYSGPGKGVPDGIGVQELSADGRKLGKGRLACGLGHAWSASQAFTPSGALMFMGGVYRMAGIVAPAADRSKGQVAMLHFVPRGQASVEMCGAR
jgi:hypothetical protein